MTKADLKTGMMVVTRNANKYIVIGESLTRYEDWLALSNFNDNLASGCMLKQFDIMEVWERSVTKIVSLKNMFDLKNMEKIWERKKLHKVTLEVNDEQLEYIKKGGIKIGQ